MALRRSFTIIALAGAVSSGLVLGQQEDSQSGIPNWPAPLFWSREAQPPSSSPEENSYSKAAVPTPPLPFIGIAPCRIADTRLGSFPPGYGPPPLAAGVPRNFTLTGRCGIPASAEAVSLNITVTNTAGPGHIVLLPQGGVQPDVSTVNYVAGQTIANAAIVPLGTAGGITVIAASGTDLLIDTNGYYAGGLLQPRVEPHPTSPNLIGGFSGNSVTPGAFGATIGGGGRSGATNRVTDAFGTVGGGFNNRAGDNAGTTSDRALATVGGGQNNTASADFATVGGGISNTASDSVATVGGGNFNTASGLFATVPGGLSNTAQGSFSFAAGRQAKANHIGAFVWGDASSADIASTAVNQFNIRASGGTRIFSNTAASIGVQLAPGGNAWAPISDRGVKENFERVDGREILARLADVPIATWNLKSQDPSIRHMGPMAQDFHSAFSVGEDNKHITTIDADGVALAAIQGLYELVREKDTEIRELRTEIAAERNQIKSLASRLAALEKEISMGGGRDLQ